MEINKKIALLRNEHDILMRKYMSESDDTVFLVRFYIIIKGLYFKI